MAQKINYTVSVKKLEKSEVEIKGSIAVESVAGYRAKALANIGKEISFPGFRKGHVPEAILVERLGEHEILEECAELALQDAYVQMLDEQKIDAIGAPRVSITKLAAGNDLEFTITTAVMPEIKLGDYKKAAKEENKKDVEVVVEDSEVESIIAEILKRRTAQAMAKPEGHMHADGTFHEGSHDHEAEAPVEGEAAKAEEKTAETTIELTDELVKTFGDFKDVADFKIKLKENIRLDKSAKAKEAKEIRIVEKIVADSKVEVPAVLVEHELEQMINRLRFDLSRANMNMEDYLAQSQSSEEKLREDWKGAAEMQVKTQLLLDAIIKAENFAVNEEELVKETDAMMQAYPGADRTTVRSHVEHAMLSQKLVDFLEAQK